MALNTETIITLQQLNGMGKKTILKLGEFLFGLTSIEDLYDIWSELANNITYCRKISHESIILANKNAKRIIQVSEDEGIGIISYYEDNFPRILRDCKDENGKPDPPIVLYYRGNLEALKKPGVAIIGTRMPTHNGILYGTRIGEEFAKAGFNVVSGLALGCDVSGHRGALNVDGTTTAILANPLTWNSIYPKENQGIAKEIVESGGLLLSEYYIGQTIGKYGFIARDRLQAGLAHGTIVIQTGEYGGTMHAVNATINSNKPLYVTCYSSNIDKNSPRCKGNQMLINKGLAKCIKNIDCKEAIHDLMSRTCTHATPIQPRLFGISNIEQL